MIVAGYCPLVSCTDPDIHAHAECPVCGAVNHGNATCATCVRRWDCSEETRRMVLDAIARGSRDTADA